MCTVVLVPLLPDLNSMVAVSGIERALGVQSGDPRTPTVFYLFNRFDELSSNDQRARDYVQGCAAVVFCRLRFAKLGA